MICSHLRRSQAKLVLVVASMRLRASALSATNAQHGEPLQPFCGALMRMSHAGCLHVDPDGSGGDAVENEQAAYFMHRVGHRLEGNRRAASCPRRFRREGEHHLRPILADAATTSSIGAGANGALGPASTARALGTTTSEGIRPISKIWLQR